MSVESRTPTGDGPGLWVPDKALVLPLEENETLWRSDAPLWEQLKSDRGEGYLMRITDPDLLARRLIHVTPGRPLVHAAIPFLAESFQGQPKRRDGKPAETHPFRVALRDAQENPDVTDVELVIDLLHDNAEDVGTTRADIIRHFRPDYGIECAELIWFGISALNNRSGGRELKPRKYHNRIINAERSHPEVHIADRKSGDRSDNGLTDLLRVIDNPDMTEKAKKKVLGHYVPKLVVAHSLGQRFEPNSINTRRIGEQLELTRELLAA